MLKIRILSKYRLDLFKLLALFKSLERSVNSKTPLLFVLSFLVLKKNYALPTWGHPLMDDPTIDLQVGRIDENFFRDPRPDYKLVPMWASASQRYCSANKKNTMYLSIFIDPGRLLSLIWIDSYGLMLVENWPRYAQHYQRNLKLENVFEYLCFCDLSCRSPRNSFFFPYR